MLKHVEWPQWLLFCFLIDNTAHSVSTGRDAYRFAPAAAATSTAILGVDAGESLSGESDCVGEILSEVGVVNPKTSTAWGMWSSKRTFVAGRQPRVTWKNLCFESFGAGQKHT